MTRRVPHNADPLRRRLLHTISRPLPRDDTVELLLQGVLHPLKLLHHLHHALGLPPNPRARDSLETRRRCRGWLSSYLALRDAHL